MPVKPKDVTPGWWLVHDTDADELIVIEVMRRLRGKKLMWQQCGSDRRRLVQGDSEWARWIRKLPLEALAKETA